MWTKFLPKANNSLLFDYSGKIVEKGRRFLLAFSDLEKANVRIKLWDGSSEQAWFGDGLVGQCIPI